MRKEGENSNSPKSKDNQRAFGFPCGKTYLSYPALFTHVKQKHDGRAPGNLIKPKTGKIRGRPKTRIDPIDIELQEIMNRIEIEIPRLLEEEIIEYDQDFEKSEGNLTCQDAASAFLDHFDGVIGNGYLLRSLRTTDEEEFRRMRKCAMFKVRTRIQAQIHNKILTKMQRIKRPFTMEKYLLDSLF